MAVVVEKLERATVKRGSEEGYCPLVRCDACGKLVDHGSQGKVAFELEQNSRVLDVAFLHDGCVDAYREERGVDLAVDDLGALLDGLLRFATSPGG